MAGKKFVKVTGLGAVLENIVISAGTASLKSSATGTVVDDNSILFIAATAEDSSLGVVAGSKWIFAKGMLFNAQNAQFEKLANFAKATGENFDITAADTVISAFGKIQAKVEAIDADITTLDSNNETDHTAIRQSIEELSGKAVTSIAVGDGLDVAPEAGTGNSLTISHENSAASGDAGVAKGDATHVAKVTIDARGHVTAIEEVELSHKTEDTGLSSVPSSVTGETTSGTGRVSAITSIEIDQFGHVREVEGIQLGTAANRGVASEITSSSENLATSKAVYTHVQEAVADLAGAMHIIGITTSEISDGGSETVVVDGETLVPKAGDVVIKGAKEYMWTKSGKWAELGDITPEVVVTALEGLTGAIDLEGTDGVTISAANSAITIGIAANTYDAHGAASTAKSEVIGHSGDASGASTIYGAKAYADQVAADAQGAAITSGKNYTDSVKEALEGTAGESSANTTIEGAKSYAKDYADSLAPHYATSAQGQTADSALQSISATGSGFVSATASAKDANKSQEVSVSLTMQPVATADSTDATKQGLAEASDVKTYVDGKVTGTFSPIGSAESDWGEFPV